MSNDNARWREQFCRVLSEIIHIEGNKSVRQTLCILLLAPIDILITQPFAGHGRSIENEATYSGNFYRLARESSPNVQFYLYQQWPGRDFKDRWAQVKGNTVHLSILTRHLIFPQ